MKELLNKSIVKFIFLFFSLLLSCYAYFCSLVYFWSCFEWSPFGYETCGLESIVWVFVVIPALVISFFVKLFLKCYYKYPRFFITYPIFMFVLLMTFIFDKGYGQGIMAISFMVWEVFIDSFSFYKIENN